jgi:hypothetical protein
VDDADQARALLERFYKDGDESAFAPSEKIRLVWDELLSRYPDTVFAKTADADQSPWSDFPPHVTDRLLVLDLRWGAQDAVIDDIVRLARHHELILYDPQGPDVHLPTDVDEQAEDAPPLGWSAYTMAVGVTFFGALLAVAGWNVSIPGLDWLLLIAGFFVAGVGLTLCYAFLVVPRQMRREAEAGRPSGSA